MTRNRLLAILRGLGLAYWHLPIVALAALAGRSPQWLLLLGVFPWIGMLFPVLAVTAAASLALPGVWQGHPPSWLWIIPLGGTVMSFLLLYRLALDRIVDHTGKGRWRWVVFLVMWTLTGNGLAAFVQLLR